MAKRKCKTKNKKAFTLIELLVVIAIIGILSTLVIAAVGRARERAHVAQMKNDINQIKNMIEMYKDKNNGNAPDDTTWAWGQNLTTDGEILGKLPPQDVNHIHYEYRNNSDNDEGTYLIYGEHKIGTSYDLFYCTSVSCGASSDQAIVQTLVEE